MGRKPIVDWSKEGKYKGYTFNYYEEYRKFYCSAWRAGRYPSGCYIIKNDVRIYILTLDVNNVVGSTRNAQYCRKVREGKI